MTKFTNKPVAKPKGPVQTTATRTFTHEGGAAYTREPESELFLLAATNMVSEDTFYEAGADRDERFAKLVHAVTAVNPAWIAGSQDADERAAGKIGFVEYLRDTLQMRSASLVMAAEYVRAGGPHGRTVVDRALRRADEPAEAIGYWLSSYGRKMPSPFKRGVADAARRLYTERNALKWDGQSKDIRFADVIELAHPRPKETWQSDLFKFLLDKRHHPDNAVCPESLATILLDRRLQAMPEAGRRVVLREGLVAEAGWSWERLSGWLPGGMDAEAWEAVIPQMGYMALIRNLRNFDEAGINKDVARSVRLKIEDPEEVAKSRQFPFRFWSAFKHAPSVNWASALEDALDLSCKNIPELAGRSLILIDTSGSMQSGASGRSKAMRYEIGALFAAVLAKRSAKADVVIYGTDSARFDVQKSESVLRYVDRVYHAIGKVGHGTYTWEAVARHYDGHDRVVIFTDEQAHDSGGRLAVAIPVIHAFNLAGYAPAMQPAGSGRYSYGGFTDATFILMGMLEAGHDAGWPFA